MAIWIGIGANSIWTKVTVDQADGRRLRASSASWRSRFGKRGNLLRHRTIHRGWSCNQTDPILGRVILKTAGQDLDDFRREI